MLVAIALVVALVPALIVPFTLSDRYLATAKVAILTTPEVMHFGGEVLPGAPGSGRSRNPLASKMAIVLSDRVLGRVVDQLPPAAPRTPGLMSRMSASVGLSSGTDELSPELIRQRRIDGLRGGIELSQAGGGSILLIRRTGGDPSTVAFLVNAVADAFVQYEIDQREEASRRAITWLNQKARELREQILRREEAMASLMPDIGEIPTGAMSRGDDAKRQLANDLRAAKLELMATQERLAQLGPQVRAMPNTRTEANLAATRERYAQVRTELEDARLRFTSTHPEVARLEAVLAQLRRQLGRSDPEAPESPMGPDVQREYRGLLAEESRLQARTGVLSQALRQLVKSTAENTGAIAEYERHEREAAVDRQMLEVLLQRLGQVVLTSANQTESSRVLDYALKPTAPIAPDRVQVLGIGVCLAIAFAFGVGLLRELADPGVYEADSVARILGTPLLGMIPQVSADDAAERQTTLDYATPAGESFRSLRTSLFFAAGSAGFRSLQVASAVPGEGKTTVAVNLAASIAQTGRKVILIDADLRRPRVDSVLALLRGPGVTELIRGDAKLEETIRRPIGFDVDVITSGELPENPTELLESIRFERLLTQLIDEYDLVVIDGPILLSVSDALLLASRADRVLLVNKLGSVDKRAFQRMREELNRVQARVIGVVVNQVLPTNPYQYPSYLQSPYVSRKPSRVARKLGPGVTNSEGRTKPSKS
jgi:capsular exopolysaccharide synthesis family protein